MLLFRVTTAFDTSRIMMLSGWHMHVISFGSSLLIKYQLEEYSCDDRIWQWMDGGDMGEQSVDCVTWERLEFRIMGERTPLFSFHSPHGFTTTSSNQWHLAFKAPWSQWVVFTIQTRVRTPSSRVTGISSQLSTAHVQRHESSTKHHSTTQDRHRYNGYQNTSFTRAGIQRCA